MRTWIAAALLCAAVSLAPTPTQAADGFTVDFRLQQWRTMHFDDGVKAEKHLKTVKDLGGEAIKENHNGHVDVRYRCVAWKQMRVDSDDEAHQWERWLKSVGFETRHTH